MGLALSLTVAVESALDSLRRQAKEPLVPGHR
jgi:hypothetical protein